MNRRNKSAWEFGTAVVFALFCAGLLISAHRSAASLPHARVSGTLSEWEVIRLGRAPALRLRMQEEEIDFRVDPSLFREAMHRTLPAEFQQGARISVLVSADEYAHPVTPRFNQDVRIAWVRGLTVGDREVFGLATAHSWEQENRRWGYGLFIVAIAFTVYSGLKWARRR